MDYILSGLVLLVNFLLTRKIKWGWVISAINSVAWVFYALVVLHPAQYGLVLSAVPNFFISLYGIYKWFFAYDPHILLLKHIDEFADDLRKQLTDDHYRWFAATGNFEEWRHRDADNQYDRIFQRIVSYMEKYLFEEEKFPVMKALGNYYIAWVREKHPEDLL